VSEKLPVHGFVLAGGKSTRMGTDKALLELGGRTLVEIAVEKLRGFCAEVSIAGNRDDLSRFAPVVREERVDCGPAAGIEAGLKAARQEWAMFVPVDVPLVPGELLRLWAKRVIATNEDAEAVEAMGPLVGDRLKVLGRSQPAFCILRHEVLATVSSALDRGELRLEAIFDATRWDLGVAAMVEMDAAEIDLERRPTSAELERWFTNVNTPNDLEVAEAWAEDNGKSKSL
jgi:molybdopterin-guanine dinucleotide biosynthesis protein A